MTPIAPDQTLLDGLHAGQRDALERLYAEYSAPIYNLCARVVCDREEAKDLTQDVFITAFDQLRDPDAEPVRKLRPWLYRVATNACFNHLRSRKRLDGGGDALLDHAASAVDEYERAETVALVEASLGQLNERYRTVLVLKDLQGLEPAEIAAVMEVSRPTADVLVHRARASFKAVFARLAGDVPAPAALGVVLLPLGLPAALQAMPPFPASFAPPSHAPVPAQAPIGHAVPMPDLSSAAGHGAAGLLAKIGAALTTKVGITAAAATVVIGGTVAVQEVRHERAHTWSGSPGHAWQAPASRWDKQWARRSLYAHWDHHGWPAGWNSGHWVWDHQAACWSLHMSDGSTWSCGGEHTASVTRGGDGWTLSASHSGSSGWSSDSHHSGSGSSAHESHSASRSSGSSHGSGSSSTPSHSGSGDAHSSDGSSRDMSMDHSGSGW
jgi:RNA polymerase sigma-70 factor (ECF subfamily)